MSASTPVARSKSAALSRVLDSIPKGYTFCTAGECSIEKMETLARKFHQLYGIACSPAQRITRKKQGLANALLVLFCPIERPLAVECAPPDDLGFSSASGMPVVPNRVSWLLLATKGSGPIWEQEALLSVTALPRLVWLGYELVRHSVRGALSWTWRRTKAEMADLHALLAEQTNQHFETAVADTLARVARQPGFAGVREQSWALCTFARNCGYARELPHLFYLQKISHGDRLVVSPVG